MKMTEMAERAGSELSGMRLSWAAVDSCTLPTAERPLRVAEFDSLFEQSAEEVVRVDPTHLVVRLSGGSQVAERAVELAARETACCAFFTFRVVEETVREVGNRPGHQVGHGGASQVRLEVDVSPQQAPVLSGLAARAEAGLGRRAS